METKAKRKGIARHPVAVPTVDSEVLKRIVLLKSQHGVDITDYYQRIANLSTKTESDSCFALMFDVR